jgi:tRNA-modifying protein YgfZ
MRWTTSFPSCRQHDIQLSPQQTSSPAVTADWWPMTPLLDIAAVYRRPAGVVRVSGHDRLTYLHSLLSQHLEGAAPGEVADFLYLDAKGNPLAAGRAAVRAGDVLLITPPEVAPDLAAALAKYTFLLDAVAEDVSEAWALASIRGPGEVDVPGARSERMRAAPHGGGLVIRDSSGGVDLLGERDWVTSCLGELGLPEASAEDWEAWRIGAGLPAWGSEIKPGRRAQELGLLPTHVHLRKGCYPGQESIAKIYNLGRPRRALAVIETAERISVGDPVEVPGQPAKVGEVTSAAREGDAWVALALVPVGPDGDLPSDGLVSVGGEPGRIRKRVAEGVVQPGA